MMQEKDQNTVTIYLPIAPEMHPFNVRAMLDMPLLKIEEALMYVEEAELVHLDHYDYDMAEAYEEVSRRLTRALISQYYGASTFHLS